MYYNVICCCREYIQSSIITNVFIALWIVEFEFIVTNAQPVALNLFAEGAKYRFMTLLESLTKKI